MGALADIEAFEIDAKLAQVIHLAQQSTRINHHAIADDAGDAAVQDARWHQVERELPLAMHHPMARVAAALIARDILRAVGQLVDELALAFIAPLGAYNRHDTHVSPAPSPALLDIVE